MVYLKPKISVIIPTYNSETTIGVAINSVINQTYKDIEVLIIDSASIDNTLNIVNTFQDSRIRVFSEKDNGVYDAMNKGLDLASGYWVYFLGSDDVLYNNDVLLEFIKKTEISKNKVYYGCVLINGDTPWAKDQTVYDGEFNWEKLISKNISHQAIFYDLNYLKKNKMRFDLNYPVCSDWDFNLRLWLKTKFVYIDTIVAIFSSGGLSTIHSDLFFEEIEKKYSESYIHKKDKYINRIVYNIQKKTVQLMLVSTMRIKLKSIIRFISKSN